MDEFSLIKRYFERPSVASVQANAQLIHGIGDDCAVLEVPHNQDLVFSLDTLVEGVHFPVDVNPADLAWRVLGASVSDLAAMGATPNNFTLALTLPELSASWLQSFSENLATAAQQYQITLAGGDTTKGPLTLSVQVQGFVDKGTALLRSGALVDDVICVTGSLGDSRAGLSLLNEAISTPAHDYLLDRFYRPVPRISTGRFIRHFASSCIDISDGLLADLGHILNRSGKGANIDSRLLPLSAALREVAAENALDWALSGGEDFELCFTLSAQNWQRLEQKLKDTGHPIAITKIGVISGTLGLQIYRDAQWHKVAATGFKHFSR